MNATLLASQIVACIRNSMQDSSLNQEIMVAGMIREAMDNDERVGFQFYKRGSAEEAAVRESINQKRVARGLEPFKP